MKKIKRKAVAPKLIQEAAAMREAGFTLASISRHLDISPRTLSRHFSVLKVSKGSSRSALVERSRERLIEGLANDEQLQAEINAAIHDDLALARAIREKTSLVVDALSVDSHGDATEAARALAAASTALKTSQEVIHRAIGKEKFDSHQDDELPTLLIREMTPADIEAVREQQRVARENPYVC
jgi:AraC-like DNA-binding protein